MTAITCWGSLWVSSISNTLMPWRPFWLCTSESRFTFGLRQWVREACGLTGPQITPRPLSVPPGRCGSEDVPQQQSAGRHGPQLHLARERQPAGGDVGHLHLPASRPALPNPPRQLLLLPRATSGESPTSTLLWPNPAGLGYSIESHGIYVPLTMFLQKHKYVLLGTLCRSFQIKYPLEVLMGSLDNPRADRRTGSLA